MREAPTLVLTELEEQEHVFPQGGRLFRGPTPEDKAVIYRFEDDTHAHNAIRSLSEKCGEKIQVLFIGEGQMLVAPKRLVMTKNNNPGHN